MILKDLLYLHMMGSVTLKNLIKNGQVREKTSVRFKKNYIFIYIYIYTGSENDALKK